MKKIFVFIYSTLQSGLFCKYKANVCLVKEQIVPFALLCILLRNAPLFFAWAASHRTAFPPGLCPPPLAFFCFAKKSGAVQKNGLCPGGGQSPSTAPPKAEGWGQAVSCTEAVGFSALRNPGRDLGLDLLCGALILGK
jgi:hypothetical protein